MNKPFLLTAGSSYYPCSGDGDWIGRFDTEEEARAQVTDSKEKIFGKYTINENASYDWFEIINLETWGM